MKINCFGLALEELQEILVSQGAEKYRARQVAEWMYRRQAKTFSEMTSLPSAMRKQLAERLAIVRPVLRQELRSADGKTAKSLLALADGCTVETVLMRHGYGNSVCVSSQVGCAMGCRFCASTLAGFVRNLTAGEMLGQIVYWQEILACEQQKVDTVVVMGIGEPLLNYDNLLKFIRLCHADYGPGMSYRSFTVSTCGLVPEIDRLAGEGLPINLAISLHAPDDVLRSALMPVNRRYNVAEVVDAGNRYARTTGRRVTYEYNLIAGINDQPAHAEKLAVLLTGQLAAVNLIPLNPVPELKLKQPERSAVLKFASILQDHGIAVTIRKEMGGEIKAACGQLRAQTQSRKKPGNTDLLTNGKA